MTERTVLCVSKITFRYYVTILLYIRYVSNVSTVVANIESALVLLKHTAGRYTLVPNWCWRHVGGWNRCKYDGGE